jgi:hypothetical protein
LPDIEVRGRTPDLCLVGVVLQPDTENGQGQICHFFPFFPKKASGRRLLGFPLQDVNVYGMVYPGDLCEAFLFRNSGSELESYPGEIAGVYPQDFMQIMSVIFAERDNIVALILHSFGIILH